MPTICTLEIEEISFEAEEGLLRLKGRNKEPNKTMKLGQYHTFSIVTKAQLTLYKTNWDAIHFDVLRTACSVAAKAEVAAVLMDEGVANLCLVTGHMTVVQGNVTQPIPKKRRWSTAQHDKGMRRFYEATLQVRLSQ